MNVQGPIRMHHRARGPYHGPMHLKSALSAVGIAGFTLACTTMVLAPQAVVGVLTSAEAPVTAPADPAPTYDDSYVAPDDSGDGGADDTADDTADDEVGETVEPSPEPEPTEPARDRKQREKTEDPGFDSGEQSPLLVPGDFLAQVEEETQPSTREGGATEGPFSFGLASFNILGSNHTKPGADKDNFAPGTVRTEWAVNYLSDMPNDIIGFSEIQRDQLATFMRATGNTYDAWPADNLGGGGVPQTMVWRKSMFTAVEKRSVTIPFMDQQRPQPYVRLRHNETGREFWVMNVHNAPRDQEASRDRAQALEIAIIQELRQSGLPVLFIGDMNDKAEIFCVVTGQTDLYTPLGGTNDGSCRPPRDMRVDWIFGSSDVQFANYRDDKSATVRRITDHAVLLTNVTVP